jgi:hypothetical protein
MKLIIRTIRSKGLKIFLRIGWEASEQISNHSTKVFTRGRLFLINKILNETQLQSFFALLRVLIVWKKENRAGIYQSILTCFFLFSLLARCECIYS